MFSFNNNMNTNERTESSIGCESSDNTLLESVNVSVCPSYLSISCGDGRCGSTLYQSCDNSIEVLQEVEDNDLDCVLSLLIQTEPNHVIVSSKSDPKLIKLLESCAQNPNTTDVNNSSTNDFRTTNTNQNSSDFSANQQSIRISDETPQTEQISRRSGNSGQTCETNSELFWRMNAKFKLHIVSHTLFAFENSKTRILSIDLTNNMNFMSETQKFLYISSLISFSNNNTFRSFGALLRFLDNNCIEIQMQTNRSTVEISSISRLYLQQLVSIDRNTYESLQVFQKEWHPSAVKQGFNQKEGLSLYGLFNYCVSKVGSIYLRKLFLRPTQEFDIIMDRLNAIEFFVEPNNFVLRDNLNQHLKHIKNVSALFNRIMTSSFTIIDLKTLYNNLINALRIRDIIVRQNNRYLQIFEQIRHTFTEDMDELAHLINRVVDFDLSSKNQTFEIHFGIDQELDDTKYVYNRLPQILEQTAEQEVNNFGPNVIECNCVYIPQIGFLTSARLRDEESLYSEDMDLQVVVRAGDRVYYKTNRTKQLDERFGDIQSEINDRQILLMSRLEEMIIRKKHLFVSIIKSCAKLDALIAMSQTAVNYRYTKPNITSDGVIEIVDGRHPLIELVSQTFVPNDYQSGGQYKKVKLISGPNACGKSVYLKQICLITYMAHIGSFVPALRANISIIDRMFTRIQTPESISTRLSTFMLDLNQISNATKNATKRSLVVVDEFGKGTQPVDGLALMTASIDHWLTGVTPHLVVSTHFHSLPSILKKNHLYNCQTFQFFRDTTQMTYLFKLIDGYFNQSIASHIAYLAAIPIETIERGLQLCDSMSTNRSISRLELQELEQKYAKYEEIATKFLEINIESEQQIQHFFETNFSLRPQESENS